jgi:CRP-like cAMP-binding protein
MLRSILAIMPTPKTDDESIVAHFSDGLLMSFEKSEAIIQAFDEPQGVYLIKSGFIKAYSISDSGNENLLLIHQAGDFIPLPWALDGLHTTGLRYEAMTDVTVLRTSKDRLRASMGVNTWLSQQIMNQVVGMLGLYTMRIQTLEYRTARQRVISELIHLAERFGKHQHGEVLINAPITHQDIADSINMTRETASRALELLFKEKIISQHDHLIAIKDLSKMRTAIE